MALSIKAQAVLGHLQAQDGFDETAQEIASACNIERKSITGVINGLVRKELAYREVVAVEGLGGDPIEVKYIRLTDKGRAFAPELG